jgi:hypothetical protein
MNITLFWCLSGLVCLPFILYSWKKRDGHVTIGDFVKLLFVCCAGGFLLMFGSALIVIFTANF